ncbi:MAG: F-type H+-transporting ATPase subunit gamma [Fusobacteriaceae bacterium]|jgi:F-type H+-transporting ATPase subunit gamma|nr:synthase subcomplex gamma subunit [Fusobacteriales bacterium]MDN5303209.1 F-type H+-transporting ATPase subunit gamma [Fusobacteriaceae bacterium]
MAKTKEIKTRIKSVQSTHQITNAMNIVSSTKFRRFSTMVENSRPYSEGVTRILSNVISSTKHLKHPLFDGKENVKKIAVIVMTSDRGLCGSFNSTAIKALEKIRKDNPDKSISVIAVGKKIRDYARKRELDLKAEYIQLIPELMFDKAKEIAENIIEFYNEDIFDEVYMVYSKFYSAVRWEVTTKKMLPIERKESESKVPYIFEPSEEGILDTLIPKTLNIEIYQAILENTASEHAARRQAMQNATDNAEEMIADLTLQYNRERQAAITQEISEIVGGASAI